MRSSSTADVLCLRSTWLASPCLLFNKNPESTITPVTVREILVQDMMRTWRFAVLSMYALRAQDHHVGSQRHYAVWRHGAARTSSGQLKAVQVVVGVSPTLRQCANDAKHGVLNTTHVVVAVNTTLRQGVSPAPNLCNAYSRPPRR